MAARYTEITIEDMERFLKRGFRALRPKKYENRREIYFDLHLSKKVAIRVWTSIHTGSGRGASKGQDAIRVQLVSRNTDRPLMKGKSPIVKRTQNWRTSLQKRIEDTIEKYIEKEDYWEDRALEAPGPGQASPPSPDNVSGPPPTRKQIDFALKLVEGAPENFNWEHYGFSDAPDEDGIRSLSRKSVSQLIDALKSLVPPSASPGREPTDKQVNFAMSLLHRVPSDIWDEDYAVRFDMNFPSESKVRQKSRREVSSLIDTLINDGFGGRKYGAVLVADEDLF